MTSPIQDMLSQGKCCAQVVMAQSLAVLGEEDELMVAAMRGLCGGLGCGSICGALAAAQCVVHMLKPDEQKPEEVDALRDWFREEYGSIKCGTLTNDRDAARKRELCPGLIENTFGKLAEVLEW